MNPFPKAQLQKNSPTIDQPYKMKTGKAQMKQVLTAETMKSSLQGLSLNYSDQYTSSGFPPKICTLILKEIAGPDLNKLRCRVLDVGCGKG